MADFPGFPLPADKTNRTLRQDDHPLHHNDLAEAVNWLSENKADLGSSAVTVQRTAGALAFGIQANTWHDVDTTGTAAARDLDVVIPGVEAGQSIMVFPDMISPNTAAGVYLDMHTIVAGVAVHRFSGDRSPTSVGGAASWLCPINYYGIIGAPLSYVVQESDIQDGAVRCRLRDCNATTTARSVSATAALPLRLVGRGPFV